MHSIIDHVHKHIKQCFSIHWACCMLGVKLYAANLNMLYIKHNIATTVMHVPEPWVAVMHDAFVTMIICIHKQWLPATWQMFGINCKTVIL